MHLPVSPFRFKVWATFGIASLSGDGIPERLRLAKGEGVARESRDKYSNGLVLIHDAWYVLVNSIIDIQVPIFDEKIGLFGWIWIQSQQMSDTSAHRDRIRWF
jgi:hypothetical protein